MNEPSQTNVFEFILTIYNLLFEDAMYILGQAGIY